MGIQKPPRYKWKIHRQAAGNLSSVLTENDGHAAGQPARVQRSKLLPSGNIGLSRECRRRQKNRGSRSNTARSVLGAEGDKTNPEKNQGEQEQKKRKQRAAASTAASPLLRCHASVWVVKNPPALFTMDDFAAQFCPVHQCRGVFHMATHTKFVLDRHNSVSSLNGEEARVLED